MEEVVISLLAPVAAPPVQRWVQEQVDELRAQGRADGMRLGRLVRSTPIQGGDWLITVDREDRDVALEEDLALGLILSDLAALGLRPCLFVIDREPGPRRSREFHRAGADAARRPLVRPTRAALRRPA